ncbi:MAG TPA: PilW family protein [Steroidobacteraceae bacterium]|jgi:type IV pilus assembly protein PilW|nr:PilW family protein [Steroidobacteraceae bacterium]
MKRNRKSALAAPRRARGFSLIELMVTVAIAMFLLFGLVTIVENVKQTSLNQTALAQLQDQERFTLTAINDAVQAAGYFADPTADTTTAFPVQPGFGAGWVFAGTHAAGVPDTLSTRFQAAPNYGPILCDGTDTSQFAAQMWTVTFTVNPNTPDGGQLLCSVNGNPPVAIVSGVQNMVVYYGVKHDTALVDYNVDTYETFDVLQVSGTDWANISAVRVLLTFQNPIKGPGQPATLQLERVIEVMGRAGLHT